MSEPVAQEDWCKVILVLRCSPPVFRKGAFCVCNSQPVCNKPAPEQCCSSVCLWVEEEKAFSTTLSQSFCISVLNLEFSGTNSHHVCTALCCNNSGAKLPHPCEVVPHKGRGIGSKKPCVLAHVMYFSRMQWDTPSFPTACPISGSLTSKDPSVPVPRSFPGTQWKQGCKGQSRGCGARGDARGERKAATAAVSWTWLPAFRSQIQLIKAGVRSCV